MVKAESHVNVGNRMRSATRDDWERIPQYSQSVEYDDLGDRALCFRFRDSATGSQFDLAFAMVNGDPRLLYQDGDMILTASLEEHPVGFELPIGRDNFPYRYYTEGLPEGKVFSISRGTDYVEFHSPLDSGTKPKFKKVDELADWWGADFLANLRHLDQTAHMPSLWDIKNDAVRQLQSTEAVCFDRLYLSGVGFFPGETANPGSNWANIEDHVILTELHGKRPIMLVHTGGQKYRVDWGVPDEDQLGRIFGITGKIFRRGEYPLIHKFVIRWTDAGWTIESHAGIASMRRVSPSDVFEAREKAGLVPSNFIPKAESRVTDYSPADEASASLSGVEETLARPARRKTKSAAASPGSKPRRGYPLLGADYVASRRVRPEVVDQTAPGPISTPEQPVLDYPEATLDDRLIEGIIKDCGGSKTELIPNYNLPLENRRPLAWSDGNLLAEIGLVDYRIQKAEEDDGSWQLLIVDEDGNEQKVDFQKIKTGDSQRLMAFIGKDALKAVYEETEGLPDIILAFEILKDNLCLYLVNRNLDGSKIPSPLSVKVKQINS